MLAAGRSRRSDFVFSALSSYSGFVTVIALFGTYVWISLDREVDPSASRLSPAALVGKASVIDGDTLEIRGQRIRLHGIDAPESGQICQDETGRDYRCGQMAATALSDKIGRRNVSCVPSGTDRYGRTIAVCAAGKENLNRWLVWEGWAIAYRRFSQQWIPDEIAARAAGRGLWAGRFVEPEAWRRGVR
jgi:endonuclease YncB( thermonuclease family)